MVEPISQYAMQIAVHTLKDRCQTLQKRISFLEDENAKLQVKCATYEKDEESSLSEIDRLKAQIALLTEQNQQVNNKFKEVTAENKDLWNKLNQLNVLNQNLGTKLNQINDSIIQHTNIKEKEKIPIPPLIRSRTFTQDGPQTKALQKNLEENGRISSELEEISLKIINSFVQEKQELESFSSIEELLNSDNVFTESFGFYYDEDLETVISDEFAKVLNELKSTKDALNKQKQALKIALEKIKTIEELKATNICDKKEKLDKSTNTMSLVSEPDSLNSPSMENVVEDLDFSSIMICPICSKKYYNTTPFVEFQRHVEQHFMEISPDESELL